VVGDVLRCPICAHQRSFVRSPLLVVTGAAGVGKSTICARLAGTISGAVLVDLDVFGEDIVSIAPPNRDYPAFWRSMMRLAHELAQNDTVVVYFSTMLPAQLIANSDTLNYFSSVHFLCMICRPDVLQARLKARGEHVLSSRLKFWTDFNDALTEAATTIPTATAIDVGRTVDEVEHDVRRWINTHLLC
jgi:gluconate kinase